MSSSAPPRSQTNFTDVEWLQSLSPATRAPAVWHAALRNGDVASVAKQLRERFSTLKKLELVSTLRWSADATADTLTIEAIDELEHLRTRKGGRLTELLSGTIEVWLDRQPKDLVPSSLDQMLACLILLERSHRLSNEVLVRLWRFVEDRTGKATGLVGTHHPAAQELLATERQLLRLVATAALPLKKSDVEPVTTAVSQFLGTFTDAEGNPEATLHASLAAALASLARFVELFGGLGIKLLDKKDLARLQCLATRAVALCPVDCAWFPSRTPHEALDWLRRVTQTFQVPDEESTSRLLKLWKKVSLDTNPAGETPTVKTRERPLLKKNEVISQQSDDSHYALLHGDWRDSRDRCVVRHSESIPTLELSVQERTLLRGDWAVSVSAGGKTWTSGDWSCCCWYSDPEADFCELTCEPAKGVTVYRQILWSRSHRFLFVADEVRAPGKSEISIESRLPLAPGWKSLADGRTREWQLHQSQSVVRLFPIFSAQERVHHAEGSLRCDSQAIMTRSTSASHGVYSAIVIDWDAGRQNSPAHWGPLSVAEDIQRVPSHLACGARWRVGDQLWMVLHQATKGDSARSALGLHSHHETVVAHVKDGKYLSLVEVE